MELVPVALSNQSASLAQSSAAYEVGASYRLRRDAGAGGRGERGRAAARRGAEPSLHLAKAGAQGGPRREKRFHPAAGRDRRNGAAAPVGDGETVAPGESGRRTRSGVIEIELGSGTACAWTTTSTPTRSSGSGRSGRPMIPIPSGVRVWIAMGHTDMRRGMQGLALQVQEQLKRDPHCGDLYIFPLSPSVANMRWGYTDALLRSRRRFRMRLRRTLTLVFALCLVNVADKRSSVLYVLVLALATVVSCNCPAAPSITSISPSSATAGSSEVELTINGNNFLSTSTVDVNGILTPSFVNSHQLVATVPAAAIAQPGTLQVLVLNPPENGTSSSTVDGTTATASGQTCGGNNSNAVSFTVNP